MAAFSAPSRRASNSKHGGQEGRLPSLPSPQTGPPAVDTSTSGMRAPQRPWGQICSYPAVANSCHVREVKRPWSAGEPKTRDRAGSGRMRLALVRFALTSCTGRPGRWIPMHIHFPRTEGGDSICRRYWCALRRTPIPSTPEGREAWAPRALKRNRDNLLFRPEPADIPNISRMLPGPTPHTSGSRRHRRCRPGPQMAGLR